MALSAKNMADKPIHSYTNPSMKFTAVPAD